ncbi:DNA polymerase III subunit delta' [Allofranklinella schreckenbergeri]|nr:DNA polymerase III subunit delta' [Allofranklinella schreckenbergeri]
MASKTPPSPPPPKLPPPMPWLAGQLDALLHQQGHALLLEGASGLGQFELGLAWAQAALCEARAADAPMQAACGRCEGCHAVQVRTHPDLLVLLPEALQIEWGWGAQEGDAAEGKRKPSREIRIEAMRQMITFSQRTDARGRGKVVLVYPAESMNAITANALLKTLEEPPGPTRFVLATQAAHRLLPTIRSRCHAWKMHWPAADAVQAWLLAAGAPPEQVPTAVQAAGGRPQDAWQWLQAGLTAQDWQRLPSQLAQGQAGLLAQATPSQAVAMLMQVCHDAMAVAAGAAPRYFEAQALQAALGGGRGGRADAKAGEAAVPTWAQRQKRLARLSQWSVELAQAARTSEHTWNPELMLWALVDQARAALHSPA